jgi:hypothetical protein
LTGPTKEQTERMASNLGFHGQQLKEVRHWTSCVAFSFLHVLARLPSKCKICTNYLWTWTRRKWKLIHLDWLTRDEVCGEWWGVFLSLTCSRFVW